MDVDRPILESLADGVAAFDDEGRLVRMTGRMRELLGTADAPPGTPCGQLLREHQQILRLVEAAFAGAPTAEKELILSGPDGDPVHLRVSTTDYERGLILAARDVSDLRRLEREVEQVEKMSALGRLAASVAHEVRNPLGAISLQLDLMAEEAALLPEPHRERAGRRLSIASAEIKRMDRIVANFLRFSRPPTLRVERVRLNDVIRRVFDLVMPEAREHAVQLSTDLSDNLPEVMGDEGQLGQALLNMVVNAFQAVSGPGQVLAATDIEGASGRVRLSLTDSGCGIGKEDLDRVFEPYYTTKAEGTGLGLAIVQRIVLDHGGRMEVESARGAGATFRILLPPAAPQRGTGDG